MKPITISISILILILLRVVYGQEDETEVFYTVDQHPQFIGGMDSLASLLNKEIAYPKSVYREKINKLLVVSFIIDSNGNTLDSSVEILKGINHECNEMALSAVKKMPKWQPGYSSEIGKHVAISFNLPIRFNYELITKEQWLQFYIEEAQNYINEGNYKKAERTIRSALRNNKFNSKLYLLKANVEFRSKKIKKACKSYRRAKGLGAENVIGFDKLCN